MDGGDHFSGAVRPLPQTMTWRRQLQWIVGRVIGVKNAFFLRIASVPGGAELRIFDDVFRARKRLAKDQREWGSGAIARSAESRVVGVGCGGAIEYTDDGGCC